MFFIESADIHCLYVASECQRLEQMAFNKKMAIGGVRQREICEAGFKQLFPQRVGCFSIDCPKET